MEALRTLRTKQSMIFERAAHTAPPPCSTAHHPSSSLCLGASLGCDGDDGSSQGSTNPEESSPGGRRWGIGVVLCTPRPHPHPRGPFLRSMPICMSHCRSQPADMLRAPIRRGSSRHLLDLLSARAANLNRSVPGAASTSQSPRFCATIPARLFIAPLRLLSSRQFQRRHQRCADLSFRSPETGHADPGPGRPLLA